MRYVDTCLLVSLFFHDSGTDAVLRWLEEAATDPIMASHWSLTEFSSAASLKTRAKQITPDLRRKAMIKMRRFVAARLTLEPPSAVQNGTPTWPASSCTARAARASAAPIDTGPNAGAHRR